MLQLYILRHMKTSWTLPGQSDFERELKPQGISDLSIVKNWIKDEQFSPAHIYCSPAVRTRQTMAGIEGAFTKKPKIEFLDVLYSGTKRDYLDCIHNHEKSEPIMFVGHNPSVASLANYLVESGLREDMVKLSMSYPTGAMTVIEFKNKNWSEVKKHSGLLHYFLTPKPYRT